MKTVILSEENLYFFKNFISETIFYKLEQNHSQLFAIGLVGDNEVSCGALVYTIVFHKLEIVSIFIDENYRRKGGGSLLISDILEIAKASEIENIGLYYSFGGEEAFAMSAFLNKNNFIINEQNSVVTKFKLSQIKPFSTLRTVYNVSNFSKNILSFSKLTREHISQLGKVLISDNLLPENFSPETIRRDISMAYMIDSTVQACAIMTGDESELCLELAYTSPKASNVLIPLLVEVFSAISSNYFRDTIVTINTDNDLPFSLSENITKNKDNSRLKIYKACINML